MAVIDEISSAAVCPECGGSDVMHFTDAYVVRTPMIREGGGIVLVGEYTEEFAAFYQCPDCGHRPTEEKMRRSQQSSPRS